MVHVEVKVVENVKSLPDALSNSTENEFLERMKHCHGEKKLERIPKHIRCAVMCRLDKDTAAKNHCLYFYFIPNSDFAYYYV